MAEHVTCPYCGQQAEKVYGGSIYPHRTDLFHKVFYRCRPCAAHVGCHPDTDKPLGRLANAELRREKNLAHAVFDPLWRGKGRGARTGAYKWLAKQLGIPREECHIGMFDVEQCRRVVEVCRANR